MKKFLDLSSWSVAIGSILIMAFAFVGCDDSSSASAGQDDEAVVELSSSSGDKAGEPAETAEVTSSSSDKTKSSSSKEEKDDKESSSSVKSSSSSSVILSASEESSSSLAESSSSVAESSSFVRSSSSAEPALSSAEGTEDLSSSSSADVQSISSESESSSSSREGKVNCTALLENETGWSWDVPKECRFNPNIDYGTMIDSRDGQVYRTVKIGDQVWMAENLNYADSAETPSLKGNSWCYDNVAANCDVAGRLYTWAAAIDSVKLANNADNPLDCGYEKKCGLTVAVRGICPTGWHLPTKEEFETLFTAVGDKSTVGMKLKTSNGWYRSGGGTDDVGFSALPVGLNDYSFFDEGDRAYFWSSTEDNRYYSCSMSLSSLNKSVYLESAYHKNTGLSVRCVKGEPKSSEDWSSSSLNGFDWSLPKEAYLNPNINYGTMTDERDGKVYRTVKIGDQIWMAENLDFDPGQGGSGEDKYDWSWCFDNDPKKCDVAGRLYTWAAAIDSVKLANDANAPQVCGYGRKCNLPAKVQGVCPPDWHLPTQAEWNTLFLSVGGSAAGKALKSQSGWFVINLGSYFFNGNGTDEFGFCALPVGCGDREGFHDASHFAEFWSSTEADYTDDWAYNACVKNYEDKAYVDLPTRKDVGTSVRCVKD